MKVYLNIYGTIEDLETRIMELLVKHHPSQVDDANNICNYLCSKLRKVKGLPCFLFNSLTSFEEIIGVSKNYYIWSFDGKSLSDVLDVEDDSFFQEIYRSHYWYEQLEEFLYLLDKECLQQEIVILLDENDTIETSW